MRRTIIDRRYKILKNLGAGAAGTVFKVKDLKDNTIIALKMLPKKKTTSEAVQRFKREFTLLAGLQHPNLCSVYDFGILKDGQSYFTMEYIDGPNIFEFTKDLLPARKNVPNGVYFLIVQLCRVLEYIHSKSLIHYDVKPGNVLVQQTQEGVCVKLMDFGLTREHQLNSGTLIRGTFPYIAPEVIKGIAIDHRADLYSFGVLLYEIFTRKRLKIDDETSFAAFVEKQEERSKRPLRFVTRVPQKMRQLITRLLDTEPAARFNRANEVIGAINKMSRTKFALETDKTLEGYLLSSRFVGRDREMDVLKTSYEKARQGNGNIVLITGDVGIGKSRLLKEFKIFVQTKRDHCFTGYCHKDKVGSFEPFYDVFKELMNHIKIKSKLTHERKLAFAVLFKVFPDLTMRRLKKKLPELVSLEPKQEILRTFESLTELIGYYASLLGELVIVLEDLHWADKLTIQFLEYLGRNLEGKNILLCGTARKEELEENIVLKKVLANMKKVNYLHDIELKPFNYKSLYSFLDSTITAKSNSPELVRYVMKKTDGNPFFVEEIMRTLLKFRKMVIGNKIDISQLYKIPIPTTIEDVVLNRIKVLDWHSRTVLNYCAVFLKDFTYDLLQKLTKLDNAGLSKVLQKLKSRQIIVEYNNRYSFYHAMLREAVINRLGNKEKRKLSYHIGRTLEKVNRGRLEHIVENLAYYFINAKDRKRGIKYGLRAAEKCNNRRAVEQAIEFYRSTLALLDERRLRSKFDILKKLSYIETRYGYYDKAMKDCYKALNFKIGTTYEKIRLYMRVGSIYEAKYQYSKALRIYQRAFALLLYMRSNKIKRLLDIYIKGRICKVYQRIGKFDNASRLYFDTARLPKFVPKERELLILLGSTYFTLGDVESYKRKYSNVDLNKVIFYFKKAYMYFKKADDLFMAFGAINNVAAAYYSKCDFKKSFNYHQKSLVIFKKIGWQHGITVTSFNIGEILYDQGYYSKALDYFRKSLSISQKYMDVINSAASLFGHGLCLHKLCNYQKAREYFERALKILNNMGWILYKAYQLHAIGRIYQTSGQYTKALRYYRWALRNIKSSGFHLGSDALFTDIGSVFLDIGKFLIADRYAKNTMKIIGSHPAKDKQIECYILFCRIKIMMKDYISAKYYCKKGINIAIELGMRHQSVRLYILLSDMYYKEGGYLKGIKTAKKAGEIAKQMGTKDLYAEALLLKAKNEIKHGVLSKIEILTLLNETKKVAEEIECPEILWKVYYEYGRFLQDDKQYLKALDYYDKCNDIFENVCKKIKNKSYQNSYLNRPDRQAVYAAKDEIARLLH